MKHSRRQSTQRLKATTEEATALIRAISGGDGDILLAYLQLYGIYVKSSGALRMLQPLFRIPGIYPDSIILTQEVREKITAAAIAWLNDNAVNPAYRASTSS